MSHESCDYIVSLQSWRFNTKRKYFAGLFECFSRMFLEPNAADFEDFFYECNLSDSCDFLDFSVFKGISVDPTISHNPAFDLCDLLVIFISLIFVYENRVIAKRCRVPLSICARCRRSWNGRRMWKTPRNVVFIVVNVFAS